MSARRIVASALTVTALAAGSFALSPPVSGDGMTLAATCSGPGPKGSSVVSIRHQFGLSGKHWKQTSKKKRSCRYAKKRTAINVIWRGGAGTKRAVRVRIEKAAATHRGFKLLRLHDRGRPFDELVRRTTVADYTYRGKGGTRVHVRAVGDKYTLLLAKTPQRAWKRGMRKTVRKAHRSMARVILMS